MIASLPQSHHDYTFAEYLTLERDSEIKHEFDDGEILAMTERQGAGRPKKDSRGNHFLPRLKDLGVTPTSKTAQASFMRLAARRYRRS